MCVTVRRFELAKISVASLFFRKKSKKVFSDKQIDSEFHSVSTLCAHIVGYAVVTLENSTFQKESTLIAGLAR